MRVNSLFPERFGCRANSKGIVPPWVAGCVARMLSRSEKRNVDHSARVLSKMRKCRDVLTHGGGPVDPGDERGEAATLDPGRASGISLGRTDVNGKRLSQKCTTNEQWQPSVFPSPTSVPRNGGKLALKPMMGHKMKYVSKSFIRRKSETFSCPPDRDAAVLSGPRVRQKDNPMSLSAERTRAIPHPMSPILPQPDVESGMVPVPMPEDAMEVDLDTGVVPAPTRRGAKRTSSIECCDCDAVEILGLHATVGGIRTEQKRMQECEIFRWRHGYEKSSMQTVLSTTTSHEAKRDETQPRVVTHEYADATCAPEHYASTLRTRALRSMISRMMSKCRTRQHEPCDTLSVFFHAWLERGVWAEPSERWRWQLARALLP